MNWRLALLLLLLLLQCARLPFRQGLLLLLLLLLLLTDDIVCRRRYLLVPASQAHWQVPRVTHMIKANGCCCILHACR
jgi:hypothetical protein